ncbi:MAG: hypothetical protein M9887_06530 [Chitinophagales bacterium]|nr:hypothetical protein [Chitinophagales bacterium]
MAEMLVVGTDFLRSIGYLSYAIASYDSSLSSTYTKFIKKELIRTWLSLSENMKSDEEDAYSQIGMIYDWLSTQKFSYKFALKNFEEFYLKNIELITGNTRNLLLAYSENIAHKLYTNNDTVEKILSDIRAVIS